MNYLLVMPKSAAKSSAIGGNNVFPVGIAYVSAYLKKNHFRVSTSNLEFCEGDTFHSLKGLIREHSIDVICTSGLSRDYLKVKEVLDAARRIKPGIITVCGGGVISGDPEPAMIALDADIGVIGEGELTMRDLAHALDQNLSYADVPGLIFRNEHNKYVTTASRPEIADLDSLPLPDYEGFSYSEYITSIKREIAYVIASRSCPYACTFCFHPSGKHYRQRSLDSLFAEIDFLVNTYDLRSVVISDELFAAQKGRVYDFCCRIAPYKIPWALQLRVSDVDVEMLKAMKDSGCLAISYGLESADDTVLKSMKKNITVRQIEHALKITREANIDTQGGFIFGDISETARTAENTLRWYDAHSHYGLELNMIHIFPGTGLYTYACERGLISDRVNFLTDGCPLINVSTLRDDEYRDLSSLLYEKNMRPKYSPETFFIKDVNVAARECTVEMECNKCGAKSVLSTDALHVARALCPQCRQRHYVDPFEKLFHSQGRMDRYFDNTGDLVALWGAGEICIKLLDKYAIFRGPNFIVVDISRSRQGYSVVGKRIFPPDVIEEKKINTVLATVVKRKNEILQSLSTHFPSVETVYLPDIDNTGGAISLALRQVQTFSGDRGGDTVRCCQQASALRR